MYDYSGSIHLYFDAKENTKLNERVDAFCLLLKENNIDIRSYNLNLYGKEKTTTK